MTHTVHVARFGNSDGAHTLLHDSGVDHDTLEAIQWFTDLPEGSTTGDWEPFHAGFPVDDKYIVRHTRPDPRAERPGMVATTVLVAGPEILDRPIGPLLEQASREPEPEPLHLTDDVVSPEGDPRRLAAVLDALAETGRAIWVGQEGFVDAVSALWSVLAPRDRKRLVFGLVLHPDSIPYPIDGRGGELQFYTVPSAVRQRFEDWVVIDPESPASAGRTASAVFGIDDGRAADLAVRLGIRQPTLLEWARLADATELVKDLPRLRGEELRGLTHLLARLAPEPTRGDDLKDEVVHRISAFTPETDFDQVRGLRTFPFTAYPTPPPIAELLTEWAARTMEAPGTIGRLGDAIAAARAEAPDTWSQQLAQGLRTAARKDTSDTAQRLLELARADLRDEFRWLAEAVSSERMDPHVFEAAETQTVSDWVAEEAATRGWARTHARTCAVHNPVAAWQTHAQVVNRDHVSNEELASRVGDAGTVKAAREVPDGDLNIMAGILAVEDPSLLGPAAPAELGWRRVWAAAVAEGLDPWTVVAPGEAVPALIDALVSEVPIPDHLLDAAADSDAADLADHPQRAAAWKRLPLSVRQRFLDRTAKRVALSGRDDLRSLEPALLDAVLREDNLAAVATVDANSAIMVLQLLQDRVRSHHVTAVVQTTKLPSDAAVRIGDLVVSGRLKSAARTLAILTATRPDLKPAAERASALLGLLDRLQLTSLLGIRPPSRQDVHDGLLEIATRHYPGGPSQDALWERAGGNPADLPDGDTPRERWRAALKRAVNGARGAPTLRNLVDTMREDYPRSDIKTIQDLL